MQWIPTEAIKVALKLKYWSGNYRFRLFVKLWGVFRNETKKKTNNNYELNLQAALLKIR